MVVFDVEVWNWDKGIGLGIFRMNRERMVEEFEGLLIRG